MRLLVRLGVLLLLLLAVGSGIHYQHVLPTPATALAAARAPVPDLLLQTQCGPAATQPVLACTIAVTNVGTAALVTTQAAPVNLALSLTVTGAQTTTVQAGLSSLCPYNTATLTQVGTDNLAAITQNGNQNDLTITQTGTNNFAAVDQIGSVNVLVLSQTSTMTSTSLETVQLSCGGATFAVGQTLSFTVSVGACSQPGGAALALSATVTPPSGVAELTASNNSFSGSFVTPSCTTPSAAATPPPVVIVNPPVPLGITITGCGSITPSSLTYVNPGQAIPVTAVPCPGSVFVGWMGGPCSGTRINPCDIAPTGTTLITATFAP
jgi:hypothetical protein